MTELHLLKLNQYGYSAEEEEILEQISLPLNRCNVPSKLLASLSYQQNPILLQLMVYISGTPHCMSCCNRLAITNKEPRTS